MDTATRGFFEVAGVGLENDGTFTVRVGPGRTNRYGDPSPSAGCGETVLARGLEYAAAYEMARTFNLRPVR